MTALTKKIITPEEYLEMERAAPTKSEYYRGEVFAMAGASPNHARIVQALSRIIDVQLLGRACEILTNDIKVQVNKGTAYYYPDLVGFCHKPETLGEEEDVLVNPEIIIEVLSRSTQNYDRGLKFVMYQQIHSLREYLLIDQYSPRVEHYVRQIDNSWVLKNYMDLQERVTLATLGCSFSLAEIYARVTFAPLEFPLEPGAGGA